MRHVVEVHEAGRVPLVVEVRDRLEIGRECDGLLVTDERVSRRHLLLDLDGPGVRATDLDSSNGTFLNGERLAGPVVLGADDVLMLGTTSVRLADLPATPTPDRRLPVEPSTTATARGPLRPRS